MNKIFKCFSLILLCVFFTSCTNIFCTHEYEIDVIEATCVRAGKKVFTCKKCKETKEEEISKISHDLEEEVITNGDDYNNKVINKKCKNCEYEIKEISNSLLNLDYDVFAYDLDNVIVNNTEDLFTLYKVLNFRKVKNFKFRLGFNSNNNINKLITDMVNTNSINPCECNFTINSDIVNLTIDYDIPIISPIIQNEKAIENINSNKKTRDESFNDFAINKELKYKIDSSESLLFALERHISPDKSSEILPLYNKMLDVLKENINDEMNEYEKLKTIHDYLILNVNIDKKSVSNTINNNRSAYLEGVFLDKIALPIALCKAFSALANIEGIPAVMVSGVNGNYSYYWIKVFVQGKFYVIDLLSDVLYTSINGVELKTVSYSSFLIPETSLNDKYSSNYSAHPAKDYINLNNSIENSNDLELLLRDNNEKIKGKSLEVKVSYDDFEADLIVLINKYSLNDLLNAIYRNINGENYVTFIAHDYSEKVVKEATCNQTGLITKVCDICQHKEDIEIEKLPHNIIQEIKEATCTEDGYKLFTCESCNETRKEIVKALGHQFLPSIVISHPTSLKNGKYAHTCEKCGYYEEYDILSTSYIDMDVVNYDFDFLDTIIINSKEELCSLYVCANYHRVERLNVIFNFEIEDFEKLFGEMSLRKTLYNAALSVNISGLDAAIIFTYESDVLEDSPFGIVNKEIRSLNVNENNRRSADFDAFAINNSNYELEVNNSEELFYCLERRIKPVFSKESSVKDLYNRIKEILINIINDSMTDLDKIKSIHDYLVTNTCYDSLLFDSIKKGNDVNSNIKSFYLEGVFDKNLAVCDGISKAFSVMCNIEGIPCVQVTGKSMSNVGHAWNKVYVGNNWYIVDATSDGLIISSDNTEVLVYDYFLVSDSFYNTLYTPNMYMDILCINDYDVFSYFKVNDLDLKVTSFEELLNLLREVNTIKEDFKDEVVSLQFEIDYECDYINNVTKALEEIGVLHYNYLINEDLFTIIY